MDEHIPVLLAEVLEMLEPRKGDTVVDCTIGGGGHSKAILQRIGGKGRLIGIDMDEQAIDIARKNLEHFSQQITFVKGRYEDLAVILNELKINNIDGCLYDLGVSSMQLDRKDRGFSYSKDSALDMRMDEELKITAEYVINNYSKKELTRIFYEFGEERWASRIADFIVQKRRIKQFRTTFDLVDIIKAAIPASARRRGGHPAKRVFQSLRIEVNQELCELGTSIKDCCNLLKERRSAVIISYHSLEDRIAKRSLQELKRQNLIEILTKKPIMPSELEINSNPRSKSARLRAFKRKGI